MQEDSERGEKRSIVSTYLNTKEIQSLHEEKRKKQKTSSRNVQPISIAFAGVVIDGVEPVQRSEQQQGNNNDDPVQQANAVTLKETLQVDEKDEGLALNPDKQTLKTNTPSSLQLSSVLGSPVRGRNVSGRDWKETNTEPCAAMIRTSQFGKAHRTSWNDKMKLKQQLEERKERKQRAKEQLEQERAERRQRYLQKQERLEQNRAASSIYQKVSNPKTLRKMSKKQVINLIRK
mmetsp:Transcript_10475/g.15741  ORF Transcript_10475/g.15741 Transcript_10475/m.15741 type:complete len:233 (-) Transcript_10475:71-769(-)